MKVRLVCISKTTDKNILDLFQQYEKRLSHYVKFQVQYLEFKKKTSSVQQLVQGEGKLILDVLERSSLLILLDEKGRTCSSKKFADFLQQQMNSGVKEIVFVIGGAYGFSKELYERANFKISLSEMTFTHQMVRLIFIEQLYRGLTILKGEKYHH